MRRIIIESPYAGDIETNIKYARTCVADSLCRGEAPIASHLLYTQDDVLDDNDPDERKLGISAGHAWIVWADAVIVYTDLGISSGMKRGIDQAHRNSTIVEYRTLPGWAK